MSRFTPTRSSKRSKGNALGARVQRGAPRRPSASTLAVLSAFVVLTAAMTRESGRQAINIEDIEESVRRGDDIVAPFSFESEDIDKTAEARDAAAAAVPNLYRVNRRDVETHVQALGERIKLLEAWRPAVERTVREALSTSSSADSPDVIVDTAVDAVAREAATTVEWRSKLQPTVLAAWLRPDLDSLPQRVYAPAPEGDALPANAPRPVERLAQVGDGTMTFSYGDRLADLARASLRHLLNQGVRVEVASSDSKAQFQRSTPVGGAPGTTAMVLLAELPDWDQVLEIHNQWLQTEARTRVLEGEDPSEWARLLESALAMAHLEVGNVIQRDQSATDDARRRAREAVEPVKRAIAANIVLQEKHQYWTPQNRADVRTLVSLLQSTARPGQRTAVLALANALLVLLALAFVHRAVELLAGHARVNPSTQFHLALLLLCCSLIAGRVVHYFEPTGHVFPAAAAAILMAVLVNARLGVIVGLANAVLVSTLYGYDWRVLIITLTMSAAGALSIHKVRRRSDMSAASLKASTAGLIAALALALALESTFSEEAVRGLLLVAMNGALCLLLVPGLLSPLERLFNITTDIQLLEYSDLNNELLGQLAIKAPGTFAHSLMLGQLAEAAAERIGANGLLARVCAYYHDIGKMRRSEYFSENQAEFNIHDTLTPRQSSRAIAAHVLQGAQMAREYHLPKPIQDGILEHHGTCLIGYFYQQARDQRKHDDVDEADFRYPGPKPQRPETAILMICDASESGVRSIKNPNEERVREFIDKIIASRAADRQFDDCDLTLKQLNIIAEVISSRIVTSLHTRVSYPDTKGDRPPANVIQLTGGAE